MNGMGGLWKPSKKKAVLHICGCTLYTHYIKGHISFNKNCLSILISFQPKEKPSTQRTQHAPSPPPLT